jgi:AcrR family transcriptional regulator
MEAMDDETSDLPASLAAAWGVRDRPAKGPKPALSLERVVAAAVEVAAAEGLAAVSMSRVAAALGASTMSLYRYVAAKDELLALMLDTAVGPPPDLPDPDDGWRPALARWAWAVRAALGRNPWVVHVPLSGPPITPNQIAWLEHGLRSLRATGLAEEEKLPVVLLVSGYVWRDSTLVADMAAARRSDNKWRKVEANYARVLATLIDAERFPAVSAMIAAGAVDEVGDFDPEADVEEWFAFGLDRILDGIDVLVRARAG